MHGQYRYVHLLLENFLYNIIIRLLSGERSFMKSSNKHLSITDRRTIENLLNQNCSFTEIGNVIKKHRTTISREVYNHRIMKEPRFFNTGFSECIHHKNCSLHGNKPCIKKCNSYKEFTCSKTINPPYVCNGCHKKEFCKLRRFFYDYSIASNDYFDLLTESRNSIHLTKSQLQDINTFIKPLIVDKDQSINQVIINHSDILNISKSTLYRYIDNGFIDIKNIDLRRKVSLKYKREADSRVKRDPEIKINRTYKDYLKYIEFHPDASIVEMDTVIGTAGGKGGKCMLTLLFKKFKIMLIYLLPYKKSEFVTQAFLLIKNQIGINNFKKYFEVILTDNGSEFFDPLSIEFDFETGEKVSSLFYCDSNCSWQKGTLERNHEYIRYVLPKGSSFAFLNQNDCYTLASHINSVPRESLNNKTPFEVFEFLDNSELLSMLNITKIPKDDVNLTKNIFK